MRIRLRRLFDLLRTGFWFFPTLMLFAAATLAMLLLYADKRFDPGLQSSLSWAYSGGPEGARSLLSTIAGSMITAASVTFSLASVALSIASQQYGSRVLRNFMRDRITQLLLGTFVSTFIYSVLVVREIRGSDVDGGFVPAIAVTVAIGLSLVSLVLLVYFVHHVTTSIQASHIVHVIGQSTAEVIPALYPASPPVATQLGQQAEQIKLHGNTPLTLTCGGYLQIVDFDRLVRLAESHNLLVELTVRPGDHLISDTEVARLWGTATLPPELQKALEKTFYVDYQRNPNQDIRFQLQQLTDFIARALSPGINDPFTAISGIDALATAAVQIARRAPMAPFHRDENGIARVIGPTVNLPELLDETIPHIAIYAAVDRFIMDRLRRVLDLVETATTDPEILATIPRLRAELDRLQAKKS